MGTHLVVRSAVTTSTCVSPGAIGLALRQSWEVAPSGSQVHRYWYQVALSDGCELVLHPHSLIPVTYSARGDPHMNEAPGGAGGGPHDFRICAPKISRVTSLP